MPDADTRTFNALLEPLRKLDALLSISRKVQIESGEVPPGVLDDFLEQRRQVERAFVMNFQGIDETLKKSLRDFTLHTRDLTTERFARNLDKLSSNVRNMLNALLIKGEPTRSLEEDMADHPAPVSMPAAVAAQPTPIAQRRRSPMLAVVVIVLIAAAGLAAAYFAGLLTPPVRSNNEVIANGPSNTPRPPANTGDAQTDSFKPAHVGYGPAPGLYPLRGNAGLFDAAPGLLPPGDLPAILLSLEDMLQILEPTRLRAQPASTREAMREFAQSVVEAEPSWRAERKRFMDAFTDHTRRKLGLVPYADKPEIVLVSDVLYAGGGGQQSLCITFQALALSARCPTGLYAPNGVAMPVIGVITREGLDTFNGRDHGRRDGVVPTASVAELLADMCERLRPTMTTPQGRALCVAIIAYHAGTLTEAQARDGLGAIDTAWFSPTAPGDASSLLNQVAHVAHAKICAALLPEAARATAAEALALYRLATAAGEAETADKALLLLGRRAEKGAMIDGAPLSMLVGDLMRAQGRPAQAIAWYRRAFEECPDDARPALRLAEAVPEERPAMLRHAYARGERTAAFLIELATSLAVASDHLAALAILDDLCARESSAQNVEKAALTCLALERPDWAQQRIQAYTGPAAPTLQRLDLICELQRSGLSERAKSLAKAWRESGNKDEFVEGLLKKYGG